MFITNACIKGRQGTWNLQVNDGIFSSIHPSGTEDIPEDALDAGGRLLCAPFVEGHIHLDFANTAGKPRPNVSGTLFEAIEIWADRKKEGLNDSDEIQRNAMAAVRSAVSHGVGFLRTHVDVTDPEMIALKALLKVKDDVKNCCKIQIVAFPQNGILAFPSGQQLMDKAMQMGADIVGGIPHLEHTREDGVASVQFVFDLAEKYHAGVDIHCDEIDDEQSRYLEVMAAETIKRGMQGRVTASHAVAMAYYNPGYMAKLSSKLRVAEMGFAICPNENLQLQGRGYSAPIPRGVAPVKFITELGLSVGFGQDSIEDPWYPIGDGNPLRNLDTGLHISHMLTADYIDRCLDFVTINPARNLGILPIYGIEIGKPASFIILDATTDRAVLQRHSTVLFNVHEGKVIFERQPEVTTWVTDLPDVQA